MSTNGIINVYKEKGYTSFDVVAILRGVFQMRKIGHTGTLDPDATGVLPVCFGKATKVVELLTNNSKTYQAEFEIGYVTDTQDISGTIIDRFDKSCSLEAVTTTLNSFLGDYSQIPPMYSALKQNGKKLYELAREGITVERKPRLVKLYEITDIKQIDSKRFSFSVTCSKGTYIRTLIYDVGNILQTGATMTKLKRTCVEPFYIEDALTLDQIKEKVSQGDNTSMVSQVDALFDTYLPLIVSTKYYKELYNGNKIPIEAFVRENIIFEIEQRYRIYDEEKTFIGIYKVVNRNDKLVLKVEKMFY